jgi:hypothetical protein
MTFFKGIPVTTTSSNSASVARTDFIDLSSAILTSSSFSIGSIAISLKPHLSSNAFLSPFTESV